MEIYLKSFNGFVLNNTDYLGAVITSKNPPEAAPVFIQQSNADSVDAGIFTLGVLSVPLHVRVIDLDNLAALEAQLKQALKPGTDGNLVVTFSDDGRDYQKFCRVVSITASAKYLGVFVIILQTGDSAYQTVADVTDTWSVTASGQTKVISVGGYSPTRLSMEITPTSAPAGGWAYQRLYQLINKAGINHGVRPWMIELDTAALVTASKMQADCDDLRVLVDGLEVKRWIADPNTNHTAVWINIKLDVGQLLVLKTAISSGSTINVIEFATTSNNAKALKALPNSGILVHGTEWIEYYGKDLAKYRLYVRRRGAYGTTLQAHNTNDLFEYQQHVITLLYGNATAVSPALYDSGYDSEKPVFDLEASNNTSWVYTASSLFYDPAYPTRPGTWKPVITSKGDVTKLYTTSGDVEGAAPAMGMKIGSYLLNGKPVAVTGTLSWMLGHPGGFTYVSMTGRKYRATATWPGVKALQLLRAATTSFAEVWNEATPTAVTTWESITKNAQAIAAGMYLVKFNFTGSMKAEVGSAAYFEILTAQVDFTAGNQPLGSLLAEKANYYMSLDVENTTNGDGINLLYPLLLNTTLDIDGESFEVTLDGVNAQNALRLDDEARDIWVRLVPGSNTLMISGDDMAPLTVGLRWKERRI